MVIMIKTEVRFKRCAPERTCETSDACARVAVDQVVASSSVLARSRFALVDLRFTIVTCNITKHQHVTTTYDVTSLTCVSCNARAQVEVDEVVAGASVVARI